MKSDNNFFIVILITICVLVLYPMLMKNMFPQYFTEQMQPNSQVEQANRADEMPPKRVAPASITYLKDKTYSLTNNIFAIEVNSPKADIKSIRLLELIDPATNAPTVLMDTQNMVPGIFSDSGLTDTAVLQNMESNNNAAIFHYKHDSGLNVRKQIRIDDDIYQVSLSFEIENPSKTDKILPYRIVAATGIKNADKVEARFNNQITVLKNKKTIKTNLNNTAPKTIEGDIELTGAVLRYFSLIVVPLVSVDNVYSYNAGFEKEISAASIGLGASSLVVPAGETVRLNYVLYAGPNDQEQMSKLNLAIEQTRERGCLPAYLI